MALRVKLDEDLSPLLRQILEGHGYRPFTVTEQGWGGLKDPQLWKKLRAEKIYFITGDKGFGDIRNYSPGTHAGITLLRPSRESYLEYERLLKELLSSHRLETLAGAISVVSTKGVRVRR